VFDGIAIHTALAQSKAHVTTFNTGIAASAASYIMMAGDTIKTARNAMWMLHDASGMCWGNATTMRQEADLLDKLSMNIADMYAMQAGGTQAEWFARLENTETWYTGAEALAAGLADEMTDADEPDEDDSPGPASNRLSVAAFNYAGRAQAPAPNVSRETLTMAEINRKLGDPVGKMLDSILPTEENASSIMSDAGCIEDKSDIADTMLAFLAERIKRA
jgi:ClpP class serine protease